MADTLVQADLDPSSYLEFLDREYLAPYVARGGAAVKLLVTGDEPSVKEERSVKEELATGLAELGDGFQHAGVDAVTTRIHLIDQVFAEVATQLDWLGLAAGVVQTAYTEVGFPPAGCASSPLRRWHAIIRSIQPNSSAVCGALSNGWCCATALSGTSSGRPCSGCASTTWAGVTSAGPNARP